MTVVDETIDVPFSLASFGAGLHAMSLTLKSVDVFQVSFRQF
jgi:hypothetical protein